MEQEKSSAKTDDRDMERNRDGTIERLWKFFIQINQWRRVTFLGHNLTERTITSSEEMKFFDFTEQPSHS